MPYAKNIKVSKGLNWLINPKEISPALGRANNLSLEFMTVHIIKDTEPFVPKKTGLLRESAYENVEIKGRRAYEDAQLTIKYSRPIEREGRGSSGNETTVKEGAPALYRGNNPITGQPIANWTTAGTGGYWIKKSIDANSEKWHDQFGNEFVQIFRNELKK